jgi:hypothetical protein
MPKRITTIGLIFVVSGLLAIWGVFTGLAQNKISLDFAVLMLPVGIGLLRGKRSSQWWARFCIILGYFHLVLLIAIYIIANSITVPHGAHITFTVYGNRIAESYFEVLVIAYAAELVVMHRLLYSEKSNSYFNLRD